MKIKKNILFLLVLSLFLGLSTACSSDSSDPIVEEPQIPEEPQEPEDPQEPEESGGPSDEELYGKEITLGDKTYAIKEFLKEESISNVKGLDRFSLLIDAPKEGITTKAEDENFKLRANLVRLDRNLLKEDISIETFKGGQYLTDRKNVAQIAKQETDATKTPLATVNADFFVMETGGVMLGAMVKNGSLLKSANDDWKLTYGITNDNEFFIDELNYTITIDEDDYKINNINGPRLSNFLVIYTTDKGEKSGANPWGSEVLLKPVNGDWETLTDYSKITCEVVSERPQAVDGGLAIPKGHIVLSGHGTDYGIKVCNRYKKGDKVDIKISKPKWKDGKVYDVKTAVGTPYAILKDGKSLKAATNSGNPGGKEPRTAVGHSKDYFYMVVVEGRSDISKGLTTKDLGDLLKHFGATDAVNLDGGKSTLLVVGDQKYGQPDSRAVPNVLSIVKRK